MVLYSARKSKIAALNLWCILLCWLVIPALVQIYLILRAHCYSLDFYEDRVVLKQGVFDRQERQSVFVGVLSVRVNQSLWGRICSYGDVYIDVPGKWDVDTTSIADPNGLRCFLESRISARGAHFYEHA